MPQRPPSLAERLRAALRSDSEMPSLSAPRTPTAPARHATHSPGAEFADRLRAAVAARH